MLEYWGGGGTTDGANYLQLHQDLTLGRNSAWQQGPPIGPSCAWSRVVALINNVVTVCENTKLTRQYTKYIRPGAQRIGATTANGGFDPVAFINPDGRWVVVVASAGGGSFSVGGLPAGTYNLSYATGTQASLPDVTLVAGQSLSTSLPGAGVLTIVSASGSVPPPAPTPPPPPSDPPAPTTPGGCTTPDPFAALGGGVCVGGNWLPPGYPTGEPTPAPAPAPEPAPAPTPTPAPPPPDSSTAGCTGPDPFAVLGGGTCANGQWLPPGYPVPGVSSPAPPPPSSPSLPSPPPQPTGGCTIPDPFASLGGGVCIGGDWLPPAYPGAPPPVAAPPPLPATGPNGCPGIDPFASLLTLIGRCVNGDWMPVAGVKTSGTVRFFAIGAGLWAIVGPDGTVYEPAGGLAPEFRSSGRVVYFEAELASTGVSAHPSGVLVILHAIVANLPAP
jgi:hypothetical protein